MFHLRSFIPKTTTCRVYSTSTILADIDASLIKTTLSAKPKTIPPNKNLVFGQTFSDHMLSVEWTAQSGWDAPKILPYGNLSIDPSAKCLHYGMECFEVI